MKLLDTVQYKEESSVPTIPGDRVTKDWASTTNISHPTSPHAVREILITWQHVVSVCEFIHTLDFYISAFSFLPSVVI